MNPDPANPTLRRPAAGSGDRRGQGQPPTGGPVPAGEGSPAAAGQADDWPPREAYFLGMVAHELKNPLTPLKMNLQLLQRRVTETSVSPGITRAIDAIAGNLDRLQRRLDRLEQAAHLRTGVFAIEPRRIDLVGVVRRAVEEQGATDLGAAHSITFAAPADLWGEWDGDRLLQAICNLIENALKFSPPETPVAVTVRAAPAEAIVEVADEGPGVRPEDRDEIFRPYSRVYLANRAKGAGLGLFIVKGIVEAHGGRVWIADGGPAGGSTFGLSLPA